MYFVEEVDAPAGYNKLAKPMAFTVDADGIVKVVPKSIDEKGNPTYGEKTENGVSFDNSDSVVSLDWNSPYYTVTISNKSGFALPETGGKGWPYVTVALIAVLLAGGYLWIRHIKEVRAYNDEVMRRRRRKF